VSAPVLDLPEVDPPRRLLCAAGRPVTGLASGPRRAVPGIRGREAETAILDDAIDRAAAAAWPSC
jgi:hypothetical protein